MDGDLNQDLSTSRCSLPSAAIPRRAIRIVAVSDGQATAEDVVLDHVAASERFGGDVAALIFDELQSGAIDVTYRTAALRYGPRPAALIFPATAAAIQPPPPTTTGRDSSCTPLVHRVVS